MALIKIGYEYKNEFESICKLYKRGFLSDKVNIKRVTDTEIVTAANTFVYCDDEHGVNGAGDGAESELKFDKNGASWFSGLRGAKFDSSSSDWEQLIADAAADYHKYYSMIEFRQNTESRRMEMGDTLSALLKKFNNDFLKPVLDGGFVTSENYTTDAENFYAVSMRLEINGGAQSEPLLGKVYFRKTRNGKYVPIKRTEARGIDDYIAAAVPSDGGSNADAHNEIVDGQLVGDVLNSADVLFGDENCADYILFNSKYTEKIEGMLKLLATSDEKELECTHVTVLGISHVEWQNFAYAIKKHGKNVLKLVVGLNNSISLYCTNCSKDGVALIENNNVLFDEDKFDGSYYLDFDEPKLGLDETAIADIKTMSLFSEHLLTVSCPDNPRNRDCARTICAKQAVEYVGAEGETVYKCKGCPYPEVVYRNIFDGAGDGGKLTVTLNLDEQAFELTEAKTKRCKCCGRTFSEFSGKSGYCRLCSSGTDPDEGKKLYKKYGKMLGLGIRLKHLFSAKYCKEDSNIIIFKLGNDQYVFDKLDANEFGYIEAPKKV